MKFKSELGRAKYELDVVDGKNVRITRLNRDGETVIYIPVDLLDKYARFRLSEFSEKLINKLFP